MIGQAAWFGRRKYGGWGLTPKTWQGWAYIAAFVMLMIGIQLLPIPLQIRLYVKYILIGLFFLDVLYMMVTLKKDEMEVKIEALAERNAAWAMVLLCVLSIGYQVITSVMAGKLQIDWTLLVILFGGVLAKAVTNIWLQHKGI